MSPNKGSRLFMRNAAHKTRSFMGSARALGVMVHTYQLGGRIVSQSACIDFPGGVNPYVRQVIMHTLLFRGNRCGEETEESHQEVQRMGPISYERSTRTEVTSS